MKWFKEREFECKCCEENQASQALMNKVDEARELAGVPFIITSGYRCEKHNREVGGSRGSSHMKGLAVDIYAVDSRTRAKVVSGLVKAGFTRIGIADSFVHADIDEDKPQDVMWLY